MQRRQAKFQNPKTCVGVPYTMKKGGQPLSAGAKKGAHDLILELVEKRLETTFRMDQRFKDHKAGKDLENNGERDSSTTQQTSIGRTLDLSRVGLTQSSLPEVLSTILNTSTSTSLSACVNALSISHNHDLGTFGAEKIFQEWLPAMPSLTSLDMFDVQMKDDAVPVICQTLFASSDPVLASVGESTRIQAPILSSRIPTQHLRRLKIGDNLITTKGIQMFCDALCMAQKKNQIPPQLQQLHVGGNHIGNVGAAVVMECAEAVPSLVSISLRGVGINLISDRLNSTNCEHRRLYQAIVSALRESPSLTELQLRDNELGDFGVKAIAEAIKLGRSCSTVPTSSTLREAEPHKCIALTHLELHNNAVTDQGGATLIKTLRSANGGVVYLGLSENPTIGNQTCEELGKLLHEQPYPVITMPTMTMQPRPGDGRSTPTPLNAQILEKEDSDALGDELDEGTNENDSQLQQHSFQRNGGGLHTVELRSCLNIDGKGVKAIAQGLIGNRSLTTLALSKNTKIGSGAWVLAEPLKFGVRCPPLTETPQSVASTEQAVGCSLLTLDLCGCRIPSVAFATICVALANNTRLKHLDLSQNFAHTLGGRALSVLLSSPHATIARLLIPDNCVPTDVCEEWGVALSCSGSTFDKRCSGLRCNCGGWKTYKGAGAVPANILKKGTVEQKLYELRRQCCLFCTLCAREQEAIKLRVTFKTGLPVRQFVFGGQGAPVPKQKNGALHDEIRAETENDEATQLVLSLQAGSYNPESYEEPWYNDVSLKLRRAINAKIVSNRTSVPSAPLSSIPTGVESPLPPSRGVSPEQGKEPVRECLTPIFDVSSKMDNTGESSVPATSDSSTGIVSWAAALIRGSTPTAVNSRSPTPLCQPAPVHQVLSNAVSSPQKAISSMSTPSHGSAANPSSLAPTPPPNAGEELEFELKFETLLANDSFSVKKQQQQPEQSFRVTAGDDLLLNEESLKSTQPASFMPSPTTSAHSPPSQIQTPGTVRHSTVMPRLKPTYPEYLSPPIPFTLPPPFDLSPTNNYHLQHMCHDQALGYSRCCAAPHALQFPPPFASSMYSSQASSRCYSPVPAGNTPPHQPLTANSATRTFPGNFPEFPPPPPYQAICRGCDDPVVLKRTSPPAYVAQKEPTKLFDSPFALPAILF